MIIDFFPPAFDPRPIQVDILKQVEAAFDSGKRFVVLEAPPGVGKSHIAATLARRFNRAYVLTVTKQLQAQYLGLFEDIGARELKGKTSFGCDRLFNELRVEGTCEQGDDRFDKNPCDPEECPYRVAKAEALRSNFTICNYHSYLWSIGNGKFANQAQIEPFDSDEEDRDAWYRELVILDEGHQSEAVLMDYVSIEINATRMPIRIGTPFPDPKDTKACFHWLELFLAAAEAYDKDELTAEAKKELKRLTGKAAFAISHRDAEFWISEPLDRKTGFVLKPLTVKSFGQRLFRYGKKVLLMSATILDAEKVTESLGIKKDEYTFVRAPCPFPKENRPVIVGSMNMTKANRDTAWPAMVEAVGSIMEGHPDEKGLLLTPSNEMLNYLLENLPKEQSRRLILARGAKRLVDYQRHLDSKGPSVLGASGFWEGADLKDDLSRFQVIPAIPRPFWGGQVAMRGKEDPRWYRLQTYQQLIQGVGRSVRSETDSAVTYVLDGDLRRELERWDCMLPEWFKEALVFA